MPTTLAIDFGSKFIGVALVQQPTPRANNILYAATLVVEPKPLNALTDTRAEVRRLRRTRKTHQRRLRRLAQSLQGISGCDALLHFCKRRGFSHQEDDTDDKSFHISRAVFFDALRIEIERLIEPHKRNRVLAACSVHLNESCQRGAELRPARFDNRGPSHCTWEGCVHNVPRAENDFVGRLRQSLFAWLLPIFGVSSDRAALRRSVEHWIMELDGLAKALDNPLEAEERKQVNSRIRRVYKNLVDRVSREAPAEIASKFQEDWKEHFRKAITAIVRGEQGGRVRFCRKHSVEFVDHILAGKQIPQRHDITEADLVSRKQQIVFGRIWRLVESRLLPLAGGRIDRVVVERVAFDVLAGPFKARQNLSPAKAAEMYWHGPMLGFDNRLDMLKEEFAGRCAYCGSTGATQQVEHLLPRSSFPFDSYFNVLPACTSCNDRKGARTALQAAMTVHPDAYTAYSEYVRKRIPPHVYHTIKKGLLNLLQRTATSDEAEKRLGMLANDLVTITATQRSPRPLARYLATKLERCTGSRPQVGYASGRHTALYRSVVLPEYEKAEMREAGDVRQHAVDAILLGCAFPPAAALENKQWRIGAQSIQGWYNAVREAAPAIMADVALPTVTPVDFLPHFEEDLGAGYCLIDLSAFNWNRARKATHQLDPFGQTQDGRPLKRVPASSVLDALKDKAKRTGQMEAIAHPGLRQVLQRDPERAAERFVTWLQQTVRSGLDQQMMSNHPADVARRGLLERFVAAEVAQVIRGNEPVPAIVGVRCLNKGSEGKLKVSRVDRTGRVFQRYQAQPVYREWHVGYREKEGHVDRSRPVVLTVTQDYAVSRNDGRVPDGIANDSPLRGRSHGSREPLKAFLARWRQAFEDLCKQEGLIERFVLTQGCVIEKTGGAKFQVRNFDSSKKWMKAEAMRDIRRVHRSPLRAMQE